MKVAGDLIEDRHPRFNEEDLKLFGLMKTAGVCRASVSLSLCHLHPVLSFLPSHFQLLSRDLVPIRAQTWNLWLRSSAVALSTLQR